MSPKTWVVIAACLLLAISVVGWFLYDPLPPCRSVLKMRGEEFWRISKTYGFLDVKDQGPAITGRYIREPALCFEVTKAEADDPAARLEGYRDAMAFWISRSGIDEGSKLTGISFKTNQQMYRWWTANENFLLYSPERDVLVVDEYHKKFHSNEFSVDPKDGDEVSNVEYWWRTGSQEVQIDNVENGFRYFRLKRGNDWIKLKVEESRLDDRIAKEQGLRKAVESLKKELKSVQYQEDASAITYKLNKLTDLSGDYEDWMTKLPRRKLVLREDGECLTEISE